jgi:hypothetical protein
MEFSEKKIREKYDNASPAIQEVLLGTWITEDVSIIGRNLGIRIDKIDVIIRVVGFVVLNLIPLSRLISIINSETKLGDEKSTQLAQKIDEVIFTKVREQVRNYKKPEDSVDMIEDKKKEDAEDLRGSLLKDIEDYANEFSEQGMVNGVVEKESFADMLAKNKTTESVEKVVDPYRNYF